MSCSYAQSLSNVTKNRDESGSNELSIATTTMTATNNVENDQRVMENNEPLNYTSYLRLGVLLSALQCLSHTDPSNIHSPHVHDEHFFILIHQVFELWFKQILFEIDSIRDIFARQNPISLPMFNINLRLTRMVNIWKMLIDQLQLLQSMTPIEFLEFRNYITPASGFQSLQFRIIEMKLGLTDPFRTGFKTKYFTGTMFKHKQADELTTAVNDESLLKVLERWLENIYDSTSPFVFLTEYSKAVTTLIEHEKNEKISNHIDANIAEREAETAKRQFKFMTDENEYEQLLEKGQRRISHKAMLAVLMISLYHQQPLFQQYYEMITLLMDNDALMASWRHKHLLLVQRQIGQKPGTGGTGGFSYLKETLNDKYQIFIDFYNVSSYLIPQRFLPTFDRGLNSPAASISTPTP